MKLKQFKQEKDEIYLHKYGRVLTANECHYRISGFPRGELYPSVTRLGFFVPEKKNILLPENEVPSQSEIQKQIEETPYWKWFERNAKEFQIRNSFQRDLKIKNIDHKPVVEIIRKINTSLGYDMFKLKLDDETKLYGKMSFRTSNYIILEKWNV